jgi:hypothetical protein
MRQRALGDFFSGVPLTNISPLIKSRSSLRHSSLCDANSNALLRNCSEACAIAFPAVTITRLAKVPTPWGIPALSPVTTSTFLKSTPR